jgi:hypothetical protein
MTNRVATRLLSWTFAAMLLSPAMAVAQPPDGPPPRGGPGRPAGPRGAGGSMGMAGPGPLMDAVDKDHDGVISAEEIRKAPEALKALDCDHNGRIDRSEMRPAMADRAGRNGPAARRGQGGFGPGGPDGPEGMGRPPEVGEVMPPFVRHQIPLDPEQQK